MNFTQELSNLVTKTNTGIEDVVSWDNHLFHTSLELFSMASALELIERRFTEIVSPEDYNVSEEYPEFSELMKKLKKVIYLEAGQRMGEAWIDD